MGRNYQQEYANYHSSPIQKKKRAKRKGQQEEAITKGYIRHRKVEVFERADLYEGRPVKRKKKDGSSIKEGRKKMRQTEITQPKAIKRRIKIDEAIMLSDLAKRMGIKAGENEVQPAKRISRMTNAFRISISKGLKLEVDYSDSLI